MKIETERNYINCKMAFDFAFRPAAIKNPRELILLLHGYSETGPKILKQLDSILPKDAAILAPNGPFPLPYKHDGKFKVGYSWYFYNPGDPDYFIDMSIGIDFILQGLASLKLQSLPTKIIGFSQGGYFAPLVGHQIGKVRQVIGIGCEYLVDEFPAGIDFRIDGIHGEKDEITSVEAARASHARLSTFGIKGDFCSIPEVSHQIDAEVRRKVAELVHLN